MANEPETGRDGADEHTTPGDHPDEQTTPDDHTVDRWLPADAGLHAPLPHDLQTALGRLFGVESIGTMGEWATEIRSATGGYAIRVQDLCHASEPTAHYGETADETYHFQCFYDAVVLAALAEEPVDVRTESPNGTTIEASVDPDGSVTTTPQHTVVSFGVSDHLDRAADGEPSHADIYAAVCPYVRAFPDQSAYRSWASAVSAATVATPLASATAFTSALVGEE